MQVKSLSESVASRTSPGSPAASRSGAAAFLAACHAAGMKTCFANPGTTELAFVRAFDEVPGWRVIPALFEGVCSGAADGYGRMLGRPALTLTHLGPGFANSIANLHNARRARSPIVNVIGNHTAAHLPFDAPLTSDIDSLARPVSAWLCNLDRADAAAAAGTQAVAQALANGGQTATVVFTADAQADAPKAASRADAAPPMAERPAASVALVQEAARRLAKGSTVLLIGGDALSEAGMQAAQRIAQHTGALLYCETFPARIERGAGIPSPERFPYFPEPAFELVARVDTVLVAGSVEPVTYFGYPKFPSQIVAPDKLLMLCGPQGNATASLQALAEQLGCAPYAALAQRMPRTQLEGPLSPASAARQIAAWLPEQAIVSVEGGTCGYPFFTASAQAARHTVLTNTGGAIGQGLPVGLGAAIACPDRRVVCVQSDGSAQYTLQSLWTMARERCAVTVLIASNRKYGVLQNELQRDGMREISGAAATLTSLEDPPLDWVALAAGYGVPGAAVRDGAALDQALDRSLTTRGPFLIEMVL